MDSHAIEKSRRIGCSSVDFATLTQFGVPREKGKLSTYKILNKKMLEKKHIHTSRGRNNYFRNYEQCACVRNR